MNYLPIGLAVRLSGSNCQQLHDFCRHWNQRSLIYQAGCQFDDYHCPHVTILQGIVARSDLQRVRRILADWQSSAQLSKSEVQFQIVRDRLVPVGTFQSGQKTAVGLAITIDQLFIDWQQQLADLLIDYWVTDLSDQSLVNQVSLFDPWNGDLACYQYPMNYPLASVGRDQYQPHITIGLIATDQLLTVATDSDWQLTDLLGVKYKFTMANIDIFHLGNYGTTCPLYLSDDLQLIAHRINTVHQLMSLKSESESGSRSKELDQLARNRCVGVELDLRDRQTQVIDQPKEKTEQLKELILVHDPFSYGQLFQDYLHHWPFGDQQHENKPKPKQFLILNVKSERIEEQVLTVMANHPNPAVRQLVTEERYFFLDSSLPMMYHLSHRLGNHNLAIRFSEVEPVQLALKWAGQAKWVWVDCFTDFCFCREEYLQLRTAGFQICLVSPELQGQPGAKTIQLHRQIMKDRAIYPDMICTKNYHFSDWCSEGGY